MRGRSKNPENKTDPGTVQYWMPPPGQPPAEKFTAALQKTKECSMQL